MDILPEKYRHDLAIIKETSDQIIRDLNVDGFEIIFSGNNLLAFDELKQQLSPIIRNLLKNDSFSFQGLLYRIDISEKDYKKALTEKLNGDFEEKISELIIRREFQKVLTRKYFSGKK
jgi:hypothetical protein